ncbi:TPA: DUF551 domain-containing protein [Klebsiella aerogenes]
MTKSTITRERIQRIIRAIDSESYDEEEIREWLSSDEIMELARMALAAMGSEPVIADCDPEVYEKGVSVCLVAIPKETAEVICQNITAATGCKVDWHYFGGRVHIKGLRLDSQPAPVVPEDVLDALQKVARIRLELNDFDGDRRGIADCLWEAEEALLEVVKQRAAMLQAEPVTTDNKLGNSRCGTKGAPALDSSSKNAESRCGNSPVIQDTWIPVSERMPEDEEQYYLTYSEGDGVCRSYFFDGYFADQYITHWMELPAAPQEVQGE